MTALALARRVVTLEVEADLEGPQGHRDEHAKVGAAAALGGPLGGLVGGLPLAGAEVMLQSLACSEAGVQIGAHL